MSTLGTFARYSDYGWFQDLYKNLAKTAKKVKKTATKTTEKAREVLEPGFKKAKDTRFRNNAIAGTALGVGGAGALGTGLYLNRNSSKNKMSEMSRLKSYADFADEPVKTAQEIAEEAAKKAKRAKRAAMQRKLEGQIDRGGNAYKIKNDDVGVIARTTALLGSPERASIASGKKSKNEFIKGLAENAEKLGRLGYQEGAEGWRRYANKAVGRTFTGKVARLGVAGLGLSAIGGAMKRNRQEQG